MRIHSFQHADFEDLGLIGKWVRSKGHILTVTRLYEDAQMPDPEDFDWLIVMGGPMGACEDDNYPWLIPEKQCIREAISRSKTILGVCLGSQILASALGASVHPNPEKEIGWHTVRKARVPDIMNPLRDLPLEFPAFEWHNDTFNLPEGATPLAASEACRNQAFAFDQNVLGLQFHLEFEPENVRQLIRRCPQDLQPGRYTQSGEEMLLRKDLFDGAGEMLKSILGYLEEHTE